MIGRSAWSGATPNARPVRWGFFPLDEELELLPGSLTPSLVEGLVRLGTWLPCRPATKLLGYFTKVPVSEPTARRRTEQAGAAYAAEQEAAVERLERELVPAPAGPAVQVLSVDGAMVPLVGGQSAEARTLAVGTVGPPDLRAGEWVAPTSELSYFSRLADAETFGRLATVETHRRGTASAGVVCAVVDGAEWAQGFIDLHHPDAVRILDFPHAAESVAEAGQAVHGVGTERPAAWLAERLHDLKHGRETQVLAVLGELREHLAAGTASGAAPEGLAVVQTSLGYLEQRREQVRYATFRAAGYPIGSGSVESANKLVVEVRLKGAGMHWEREHVTPMLALRNVACSDRWEEAWPLISARLRADAHARTRARRAARLATARATTVAAVAAVPATPPATRLRALDPPPTAPPAGTRPGTGGADQAEHPPRSTGPRRPGPNHPWRRRAVAGTDHSRLAG